MAKYYKEITLLPNADIALYFLWSKVYQQVHLAFVDMQKEKSAVTLGVSFPEYNEDKNHLGSKLRIFGDEKDVFESLSIEKWLDRLMDYIEISSVMEVPSNAVVGYASFLRVQVHLKK